MQRIVIIGTSSSGKTTLGKNLAQKLNITHQELDFFFWEANWTMKKIFVSESHHLLKKKNG